MWGIFFTVEKQPSYAARAETPLLKVRFETAMLFRLILNLIREGKIGLANVDFSLLDELFLEKLLEGHSDARNAQTTSSFAHKDAEFAHTYMDVAHKNFKCS